MSNKEIVTDIIESLDLIWPTSKVAKITKEKLIDCWSEYRDIPDWKYFGYTTHSCTSRLYKSIFINVKDKPRCLPWKTYILFTNNLKFCTLCKNLLQTKYFGINRSRSINLDIKCKSCNNYMRDKVIATKYKQNNKEKLRITQRAYRQNNKDKINALNNKRNAAKINRTPVWLTEDDNWMMQEAYSLAKEREKCTGIKWHVDHIIPLHGKLVSGLHVPTNLQVITARENMSKSNKYNIN